jgi:hypothetical protein
LKISFNNILPSTSITSKWSLSYVSPRSSYMHLFHSTHVPHDPPPITFFLIWSRE